MPALLLFTAASRTLLSLKTVDIAIVMLPFYYGPDETTIVARLANGCCGLVHVEVPAKDSKS
jgi:hypothetical protein